MEEVVDLFFKLAAQGDTSAQKLIDTIVKKHQAGQG